jgi:hypothetical protein
MHPAEMCLLFCLFRRLDFLCGIINFHDRDQSTWNRFSMTSTNVLCKCVGDHSPEGGTTEDMVTYSVGRQRAVHLVFLHSRTFHSCCTMSHYREKAVWNCCRSLLCDVQEQLLERSWVSRFVCSTRGTDCVACKITWLQWTRFYLCDYRKMWCHDRWRNCGAR